METATVFEEMERKEREAKNKRLVILLLVRPQDYGAKAILDNFNYMHYNTGSLCNVYAVGFGFGPGFEKQFSLFGKFKGITQVNDSVWYYSDRAFYDLKLYLESILDWQYHGESTAIILQNDPEGIRSLDFHGAASIDLECAIRRGFSFSRFMEELIHNVRTELENEQTTTNSIEYRIDVERMAKEAFLNSHPLDSEEAEKMYHKCVKKIAPNWRYA